MSFLDHLEVLRWHLVRSAIAVMVFAIAAFIFKDFVFDGVILALQKPDFFTYRVFCKMSQFLFEMELIQAADKLCFKEIEFNLININMAGQFTTHIVVSILAGIVLAFPYLLFEIWRFIKPALQRGEKKYARGIILWGSLLFISGILFGYYMVAPMSVQFLGSYHVSEAVTNQINLKSYMTTVTSVTLACGIIFQLPLLVYFLTKLGLITPKFLKKYRRHALVAVLVLSAIITPPDVSSQILLAVPLMILYEFSIVISKRVEKKARKRA